MATAITLVTVEEFRKLVDPPGVRLELQNGKVVEVARPKLRQWKVRKRVSDTFDNALAGYGVGGPEFSFRAQPEYELRVADVAWIRRHRFDAIDDDDNLHGAPEIVVEVLSPSNTVSEMIEKRNLCLANGCEQFWIVDSKKALIEIATPTDAPRVYRGTDRITLGNTSYSVNDILSHS